MSDDAAMFVGIDVGKYQVDVALGAEGPVHQFKNDDEGIDQVLKLLAEHRIALVVMEASGGYQRQLLASLVAQKLSGTRGQSATSARFRQGCREAGKNGQGRRANLGALR